MITTVTLNPAEDKTFTVTRLVQGQVNRIDSVKNIAGGKGINVSKVLRQYGYDVRALGFLGGYTGKFIEDYVRSIGAECFFTYVNGETRVNINILSQDGYVTELLEPGPDIREKELSLFFHDFEQGIADSDLVILSGSAPEQVPATVYHDLILRARNKGKKVILDSSGVFLKESINACPYMVKPNIKELEILSGRKIKRIEDAIGAALQIGGRGIHHVMVSMGAKGLLYINDREIMYAKAPEVKAVNTVGCGDSVVAAFAMACKQEMSNEELLKFCVGISAANATTLESAVIPMDKAEELMEQVKIIRY
ncbi:1-phosphofructokinase [bacterium 1xD42-62]|uniref:Tagatose-6-phosphate kinase n=2 Tax=Parablautia muri TaxID=2320879 RepID=A0A9X5GTG2_9FIRM|nr:1-phosphofructokinase [Parablautia muri]